MFAMCNATDTFDIALAAEGIDIVESMYDGTPADPTANGKLHYENTFAFRDFKTIPYPYEIEFSDIDNQPDERVGVTESNDFFTLFQFSAKWDPVPSMLTQNHQTVIKGFLGQTTAFKNRFIKPEVVILAENKSEDFVCRKYYTFWSIIHGLISINLVNKGRNEEMNQRILQDAIKGIIKYIND